MRKISQYLSQWPVVLLVTIALAAAILLPSLGRPGLWEMTERSLSDRVAPPLPLQKLQDEAKRVQQAALAKQPKHPSRSAGAHRRTIRSRAR